MQFGFVTKKLYDVIGVCFSLQNNEVPLQKRQQNLPAILLKVYTYCDVPLSHTLDFSTAIRFYSNKNYYSNEMKEGCESPGEARGRQSSGEKWRKECLRLLSRHFSQRDLLTRSLRE